MEIYIESVDTRSLDAAVAAEIKYGKKAARQIVFDTAYHIIRKAIKLTPHAEISNIDSKLGVYTVLQRKKKGSGFKRAARTRRYASGLKVKIERGNKAYKVPLAAAIIQASVWPGMTGVELKRWNRLTNNRWMRGRSPFAGLKRAQGRQAMRDSVHRLIAARHSSTHLIVSGWAAGRDQMAGRLSKFVVKSQDGIGVVSNKNFGAFRDLSSGDNYQVECANRVGMEAGRRGDLTQKHNEALWKYGRKPLQDAINDEAAGKLRLHWEKLCQDELVPAWNKA